MKALVFRHSLVREPAATIGGRLDRRAFVSRLAPERIEDVDEPPLPSLDADGPFSRLIHVLPAQRRHAGNDPASRSDGHVFTAYGWPSC